MRSYLLARPRALEWSFRIDGAPALLWIGCLATALLPTWVWMTGRMLDRSDDPLGLLALAVLAGLVWRHRGGLLPAPRLGWLAAALAATLAATLVLGLLPPLACALLALAAFGATLAAFLPHQVPSAPVLGLALLSLPWIASLQFYAGFPLRALTAEASRWLLTPFFTAERAGSALWVDGRLVIVDAPCSGVQMLWLGYFTACAVALVTGRASRSFLARLPAVSVLVLAGNIVRNTVLVALEATGLGARGAWHEAVGLMVLGAVCLGIGAVMARPAGGHDA